MTEDIRPMPFFVADDPSLDFLNSIATPRSVTYDWLETGQDLLDWMVQAKLVAEGEIAPFRDKAAARNLEQARSEAVAFRERFRSFIEAQSGAEQVDLTHSLIAELNAILARGPHVLQIEEESVDGTGRPVLARRHPLTKPQDLMVRIAEAAARLITEAHFPYVRNCEGPTCTLYFLDKSKNHKRRWCSMEVCGNRAKAAAHRNR